MAPERSLGSLGLWLVIAIALIGAFVWWLSSETPGPEAEPRAETTPTDVTDTDILATDQSVENLQGDVEPDSGADVYEAVEEAPMPKPSFERSRPSMGEPTPAELEDLRDRWPDEPTPAEMDELRRQRDLDPEPSPEVLERLQREAEIQPTAEELEAHRRHNEEVQPTSEELRELWEHSQLEPSEERLEELRRKAVELGMEP